MRQLVDLDAAVAAGIIGEDQALALRNHEARQAGQSNASAEQLHLSGGLSDLMTAGGLFLVLLVAALVASGVPLLALAVLAGCWIAAHHFTARRRMLASSFVVFGFFCLHIGIALDGILTLAGAPPIPLTGPVKPPDWFLALIGATGAMLCTLYWRRHRLPIAVTFAAIAIVQVINNTLSALIPDLSQTVRDIVIALWAVGLFAYAMVWDLSDIRRETERSDVAFWLHCAAAFFLTQAAFSIMLGASPLTANGFASAQNGSMMLPFAVLCMYAIFCTVALVVDRRSLVVSSLIYAVPALMALFDRNGSSIAPGLAMIITGLFLVTLSLRWTKLRRALLARLPSSIVAQVPRSELQMAGQRPTRQHLELGPRRTELQRRGLT